MSSRDRDDVEYVKRRLGDPREVARLLGLDRGAKSQAAGILVSCPAHDDRDPSCSLTRGQEGTLRVRCFGCDFSGDIFTLVAAVERLDVGRDFPAVLARAAELAGAHLDRERRPVPQRTSSQGGPRWPPEQQPLPDDRFAAVIGPVLHCGYLDDSPIAEDVTRYLAGRGLLEAARADGWAALPPPGEAQRSLIRLLVDATALCDGCESPFTATEFRRSGLLGRGGFTHPDARLCIPWRDPAGRVYNLQRRRIDAGQPRYVGVLGRSFPWPYGAERIANASADETIAIVEGAVDVLALRALLSTRGEPAIVLGVPGLAGWRAEWGMLARGRIAAVAVDADAAGEHHVMQIAHDLAAAGARRIERWTPPAKDWAAAIAKGGA